MRYYEDGDLRKGLATANISHSLNALLGEYDIVWMEDKAGSGLVHTPEDEDAPEDDATIKSQYGQWC